MPLPDRVVLDRSALYPILIASDVNHYSAKRIYERLIDREQELWITSCVLIEILSHLQDHGGLELMSTFFESTQKLMHTFWLNQNTYLQAWRQMLNSNHIDFDFIDWTTAVVAKNLGAHLLTFNKGFAQLGIAVLPRA